MVHPSVHRSDAEIFAEARKALDDQPTVPQGVHVHVNSETATLTGSVKWPFERTDAEQAVRGVEGIRDLVNKIVVAQVVNPAGFEAPDDSR